MSLKGKEKASELNILADAALGNVQAVSGSSDEDMGLNNAATIPLPASPAPRTEGLNLGLGAYESDDEEDDDDDDDALMANPLPPISFPTSSFDFSVPAPARTGSGEFKEVAKLFTQSYINGGGSSRSSSASTPIPAN